jgi:hypothetical protein
MLDPVAYPNLAAEGYVERSRKSPKYNCIAWAAGENHRWWSPSLGYYWPPRIPRANTIDAYIQAFARLGYVECAAGECSKPLFEGGYDRVALYALLGTPKHAARQVDAQKWTSKIGQNIDIEHTLNGLVGPYYGRVVKVLRRKKQT